MSHHLQQVLTYVGIAVALLALAYMISRRGLDNDTVESLPTPTPDEEWQAILAAFVDDEEGRWDEWADRPIGLVPADDLCPSCGREGVELVDGQRCLDCLVAALCCPDEQTAARLMCRCRGRAATSLRAVREQAAREML